MCFILQHQTRASFYFASVQEDFKALSSVEQERSSPDVPLKGSDSLTSAIAADDDVGGSDMSSEEEEEGEGEGTGTDVAKKRKEVDAEALFGEESSDSAEEGDASPMEAGGSEPKPAHLQTEDLFGEADDISS